MKEVLLKKARLMKNPVLSVSRDFVFPFPLSRSTAGPGAGSNSVAVEFGDQRIKMKVVREEREGSGDILLSAVYQLVEVQPETYHGTVEPDKMRSAEGDGGNDYGGGPSVS